MKQKVFGLDIGSASIKAVWLSVETNTYFLSGVGIVPAPEKGMRSESPLDQEELAQAIRSVMVQAGITTKYVAVALPENQVYTRVIEMPNLSDKELVSAIYWEAEQYIPVPLNTVTIDYKILRRSEKTDTAGKMDVLLVGAPTVLIDKYVKILSLSGLVISSIETEILSVIRSTILGPRAPSSLLITIGAVSTSLAIVRNGVIVFAYSIPTGGVALTRAIAADFGFSLQQAEQYKQAYGLSEKTLGGKIAQAAQPVLSLILTEVRKAIAFYTEKFPDDPVRQVLLAGGSAKLPGLTVYLANALGIETVVTNPWKILGKQEVPKNIIDNASEYAVAVGLAMR
ncbi:MAG TPA: type IV pilus assembly protein PilM [Patescibacteria group bacterium]|nr:type IV pilus assembly protein PilM [Patescibacteria group bacterium]